jgi:uncharacterized protein (TIGR02594 family)
MYRRFLTPAVAAVSIAGVALANVQSAHSKPIRGQQAEAKQTEAAKRHAKHARRSAKRTKRVRNVQRQRRPRYMSWGDQTPDTVMRAPLKRRAQRSARRARQSETIARTRTSAARTRAATKPVKHSAKRVKQPVQQAERVEWQQVVRTAPRRQSPRRQVHRHDRVVARNAMRNSRARKAAQPQAVSVRLTAPPNFPARANPLYTSPVQTAAPAKKTARHSRAGRNAAGRNAYAYAHAYTISSSDIVSEARRYIGTNPTGRRALWCARFMNFVLQRLGYRGTGSDMAQSFASYGTRISGPQVGAIAVFSRGVRGGHVGVVSGVDEKGNPIIISGNHNNSVAEAPYPRSRVRAYVLPHS